MVGGHVRDIPHPDLDWKVFEEFIENANTKCRSCVEPAYETRGKMDKYSRTSAVVYKEQRRLCCKLRI